MRKSNNLHRQEDYKINKFKLINYGVNHTNQIKGDSNQLSEQNKREQKQDFRYMIH